MAELTTKMITKATMIEIPSDNPSGNPSLMIPIMMETTAAAQRITLIGSLKLSRINSQSVAIFGGGNELPPYKALDLAT